MKWFNTSKDVLVSVSLKTLDENPIYRSMTLLPPPFNDYPCPTPKQELLYEIFEPIYPYIIDCEFSRKAIKTLENKVFERLIDRYEADVFNNKYISDRVMESLTKVILEASKELSKTDETNTACS